MTAALENLPLLTTIKVAGEIMGLTDDQVRGLLRDRRIRYVLVGKRYMIPRDGIAAFVSDNTVEPCQDETKDRASGSSPGPKAAAAGSAQRALKIANKLKSHSPSSSTSATGTLGRVIPMKSS